LGEFKKSPRRTGTKWEKREKSPKRTSTKWEKLPKGLS